MGIGASELIVFIVILGIGLLPYWIASSRAHPQKTAILMTVLFLGWTGFGWAGAMIWAFWNFESK